jgi:hypothetical protein
MLNRNANLFVAGAAIFALASAASAQSRPTSTKRIPIAKESPGEVVPVHDTVTLYKTDTLRLQGRIDTVTNTVTNTVTIHDTVTRIVPPPRIGGMYFGLAGGGALPFGAIRTVNQPGWVGQAQLGWQGLNSLIGIRGDLSLTQYAHASDYAFFGDRPKVWNANLDAKLQLPIFQHTLGSSVLMTPYVIGGGSYLRYTMLRMKVDTDGGFTGGVGPNNAVIATSDDNTIGTVAGGTIIPGNGDGVNSWGWNAGGGLSFHAGRKEMFIEARGVHFNHGTGFSNSWHVPIIFGVNLY